VSRLLRSLEAQGLAKSQPAPDDARVRRVTLTTKGRREVDALDRRSQDFAISLLASLGASQRERLTAAMAEVERLMRAASVVVEPADPASADARACIEAYLRELAERFESGFDPSRGPSADPRELVPPSGVLLLARLDGEALGCGALKALGDGVGEIKRMWVAPAARGLGIAQRLLDALEQQAHSMSLHTLRLDTNRTLLEARALYARNGYVEIPAYNDNPYADHWFEKRLG
jgi:GNAT superfamily N-acetyltransferase